MGYAHYIRYVNGQEIEAGYGVGDTCWADNCDEKIDRGLYYLCGGMPDNEWSCGGYFCDGDMCLVTTEADHGDTPSQLCWSCLQRYNAENGDPS